MATYNNDEFTKPSSKGQIPVYDQNGKFNTGEEWNGHTMQEVEDFLCRVIDIQSGAVDTSIPPKYPVRYIIDQRGNISDPYTMVGDNFILVNGNKITLCDCAMNGNPAINTLTWIRKNTHRYVGKYENEEMQLKQLDDNDSTHFSDGNDATDYIRDTNNTGLYDVWVKFPCDIYYKSEGVVPPGETEIDEDYVMITIATSIPEDEQGDNWNKWDGNKLIGAYKAFENNNRLYSLSGKIPRNVISQATAKKNAHARGVNFKIIDYDTNKITCLLFYGLYGTLDSQKQCGYGTSTYTSTSKYYPKKTGLTDIFGMTDTNSITGNGDYSLDEEQVIAGYGPNIKSINFIGLDNFWGDISEGTDDMMVMQARRPSFVTNFNPSIYLDDFLATQSNGTFTVTKNGHDFTMTSELLAEYAEDHRFVSITDINGKVIRILESNIKGSGGYIGKMMFGDHADTFLKELGDSDSQNFCDYGSVNSAGCVAFRSYISVDDCGGVAFLTLRNTANSAYYGLGSRLLYEGNDNNTDIVDNFN